MDGDDSDVIELQGHKFATTDTGAPMLCSLFCTAQGRHTHIDFCRALSAGECRDPEVSHITVPIQPNPEKAKDWVTHELHWQRLGMCVPSFGYYILMLNTHRFQRYFSLNQLLQLV